MAHTDYFALLIRTFQNLFHLFELLSVLPVKQLIAAESEDIFTRHRIEFQFERGFGLSGVRDARIMHKCLAIIGVRRHGARRDCAETFDYCGLTGAILTKNERKGLLKVDLLLFIGAEGTDPPQL